MKASRVSRVVVPYSLVLFLLFLSSCTQPIITPTVEPQHFLTIANNTSYDLCFVRWSDDEGHEYSFASDQVYDSSLQTYVGGMLAESECRLQVGTGSSPIRFFFADQGDEWETVDSIRVAGDSTEKKVELSEAIGVRQI